MSIVSQINALKDDRDSIKLSIGNKNITVPSGDGFDDFAGIIESFTADGFQSYSREWTPSADTQILNFTNLPFEPDIIFLGYDESNTSVVEGSMFKTIYFKVAAFRDTVNKPRCISVFGNSSTETVVNEATEGNSNAFKTASDCVITSSSIYMNFAQTRGSFYSTKYFKPKCKYTLYIFKSKYNESYFQLDNNGLISLKPEYRGTGTSKVVEEQTVPYPASVSDNGINNAGSKMNELPEELWIPSYINNVQVLGLAEAMFAGNTRIKKIHLPQGTTIIPECFCKRASYVERVYNTEYVTTIGEFAFQLTSLQEIYLPRITSIGSYGFNGSTLLKNVILSDTITSLPEGCFSGCSSLVNVVGCGAVKNVGNLAFWSTYNLNNLDSMINCILVNGNTSSIGNKALIHTKINADWESVANSGCSTTSTSTPYQYNAGYTQFVNKQKSGTIVAKTNSLGSTFNQMNVNFKNEIIGATLSEQGGTGTTGDKVYGRGCVLIACMHAYCALKGYDNIQSPMALEQVMLQDAIANGTETEFRNAMANYTYNHQKGLNILTSLGVNVVNYTAPDVGDTEAWQTFVDNIYNAAQSNDTYLIVNIDGSGTTGHELMIYGVKDNGELLMVDSGNALGSFVPTLTEARMGFMMPQDFIKYSVAVVTLN